MQKAISKYWPIFVLPTLVAFIIGFIWPFIWGVYLSFQRFTTVSKTTFVGIQNYLSVFQDSTFLHAFGFTAVFTVVSTVLINVCAFAIALVLTRGIKGTNIFRTVFFMPNLIGGILLGYIWQILLNGVLAVSDAGCAALFCKAALQASALNVAINTKLMTDRAHAAALDEKSARMLAEYLPLADEVYQSVASRLRA